MFSFISRFITRLFAKIEEIKKARAAKSAAKALNTIAVPIWEGNVPIIFSYMKKEERTRRELDLLAVLQSCDGSFYLRGFCKLRGEQRHFRLEKIITKIKHGTTYYDKNAFLEEFCGIDCSTLHNKVEEFIEVKKKKIQKIFTVVWSGKEPIYFRNKVKDTFRKDEYVEEIGRDVLLHNVMLSIKNNIYLLIQEGTRFETVSLFNMTSDIYFEDHYIPPHDFFLHTLNIEKDALKFKTIWQGDIKAKVTYEINTSLSAKKKEATVKSLFITDKKKRFFELQMEDTQQMRVVPYSEFKSFYVEDKRYGAKQFVTKILNLTPESFTV